MVQDLVHNLCESLVENIGGVSGATSRKVVVATPVITLTGNSVTITCATTGATIYYTLDGSTPTSSSTQYSAAFTLDSSCTIKAIAIKGGKSSGIAEEEYVKPITYLTQWQMMGNSVVHTDEYLTQWKVEGNSVVDNNAILSCGDLGQDGKYHVKISNGVTIYDIPLTEPLRKVNDVADSIEFVNGVVTVTRNLASADLGDCLWTAAKIAGSSDIYRMTTYSVHNTLKTVPSEDMVANILTSIYNSIPVRQVNAQNTGIGVNSAGYIIVFDGNYNQSDSAAAFKLAMDGVELIYELATPTTEVIQVSPFPISPTDTYTSANDTPYSAFEYKKNVEIWSCGEYNATDGKYHILVQPLGGSIADIALDEPLRKVNDVADSIEYADDVATVVRNIKSILLKNASWNKSATNTTDVYRWVSDSIITLIKRPDANSQIANILCSDYSSVTANNNYSKIEGISVQTSGHVSLYNASYNQEGDKDALILTFGDAELLYTLSTPTTEVIQVPQIQEADTYTCVISQGGKAVEWSSFETE